MSPGRLSAKAALQQLQDALGGDPDSVVIASKAAEGRRELGLTVEELLDCLRTLTPQQAISSMGTAARNPQHKPGVHYAFQQTYDGKDIYVKFRINKDGPIEVTSFCPYGSIR